MALIQGISSSESVLSPMYCMLKGLFVFKQFVVRCVRALSLDMPLGFCNGSTPESKSDANLLRCSEIFIH